MPVTKPPPNDPEWNLSNPAAIMWMQKKQQKLKSITDQARKREEQKDPLLRLQKFKHAETSRVDKVMVTLTTPFQRHWQRFQ